jgi:copper chaperone
MALTSDRERTSHQLMRRIMKTIQFKTNINCTNCLAKVTPFLDRKEGIQSWKVDIDNPDKILTVETELLDAEDIVKTIKRTGFEAEVI